MNATQALPHNTCPLCGQANQCAPAASGDLSTPCWCRQATFSADLLARVPEGQRGLACICAACAAQAQPPSTAKAPSETPAKPPVS